ncbi:MAG: TetR/AcrR family transcriptional regulator, partial [Ktedonobacteraceae bacterium]|nr:TetR/AcrR family transcriptional regulator [Ktedonobacteraceae bacterium]
TLPKRHNENGAPATEESSKRQERGQRILDSAAELVRRWGYGKTTIDDIARQAGVAKGTIYLHWKTREDLFKALMLREEQALADDIKRRVEDDPDGATLHGIIKHTILAILKNPLMKAVFMGDTDMLGEIARMKHRTARYQERLLNFNTYFDVLRSQGIIRSDLSPKAEIYMFSAISTGFLLVDPLLPDEFKLSDEEAAEMLAETIRRTFAPDQQPPTPEATQTASQAFDRYFEQSIEGLKEEARQDMEQ